MTSEIKAIMFGEDIKKRRALLAFDSSDDNERVRIKFNLWAKYYQSRYFKADDADFHKDIDLYNIQSYRGQIDSFVDIVFRGGAKSARTKLFTAFVIGNDLDHSRKYISVLASDINNAKQIVVDIYNIFVNIKEDYPEIFEKTDVKREETKESFTTATGVKMTAKSLLPDQRGKLQEYTRPDWIWYEDFENRKSLRSAVITQSIWDNMEEARTGLAKGGSCVYTCNYISEAGNVHKLVLKKSDRNIVMIVPIIDKKGKLAWEAQYSLEDVERMRQNDDDFEGERLCEPSAGADIIFNRDKLTEMEILKPTIDPYGFKIFHKYDETHFYASGHDVAGGVGLDSSSSVFIDFSVIPRGVVATYASNKIKPEIFGEEIVRQQNIYGKCVSAPENNIFTEAILRMKQLEANIYVTERKDSFVKENVATEYGWKTTSANKGNLITSLVVAINDGHLVIPDEDLVRELMSYTRNDMMDRSIDPRLTTRHFDLLIACAIAWQMKDYMPVFFPKPVKPDTIKRPLNMGWLNEKQQMDDILKQTYL